jgi:hypothetical protein
MFWLQWYIPSSDLPVTQQDQTFVTFCTQERKFVCKPPMLQFDVPCNSADLTQYFYVKQFKIKAV